MTSGPSRRPSTSGAAGYTRQQAARLSGCTPAQLDDWRRRGLIAAQGAGRARYEFRDLVALRMVRSLLDAGLPLVRIRRALEEVARAGDDVVSLRLVTDGRRVWVCHDDGQILDALGQGQLALFVAVDRIAAEVESDVATFSRERQSFVDELRRPENGRPEDGRASV